MLGGLGGRDLGQSRSGDFLARRSRVPVWEAMYNSYVLGSLTNRRIGYKNGRFERGVAKTSRETMTVLVTGA